MAIPPNTTQHPARVGEAERCGVNVCVWVCGCVGGGCRYACVVVGVCMCVRWVVCVVLRTVCVVLRMVCVVLRTV